MNLPDDFKLETPEEAVELFYHRVWGQKWLQYQLSLDRPIAQCPTCGFADGSTLRGFVEYLLKEQREELLGQTQ